MRLQALDYICIASGALFLRTLALRAVQDCGTLMYTAKLASQYLASYTVQLAQSTHGLFPAVTTVINLNCVVLQIRYVFKTQFCQLGRHPAIPNGDASCIRMHSWCG
jgi:hypothetical protein